MTQIEAQQPEKLSWKFPGTFWYANAAELCERAAFYGMFITLVRYLNRDIGFTDVETGWITGGFASILYLLPTFMGIMADKIGFKQALMIAFALLTAGYGLLGAFQLKITALAALALIMFGGAIIKPVISGTVAKCSDTANRARAMSIFYMVVNIGSFSGKGLAAPLNEYFGLQYINFYAAGMSFAALLIIALFYQNVDTEGVGKTVGEALRGLWTVLFNFRFLALILIIAGFWAIQGQLYGAMPTYIERVLGKGYKPEWLANINPLTVVIFVVLITHLVRKFKPVNAIGIGLLIIPFTALLIALAPALQSVTGASIAVPGWQLSARLFWPAAAVLLGILAVLFMFCLKRGVGVPAGAVLLLYVGVLIGLYATGNGPLSNTVTLGGFAVHPLILLVVAGIAFQGIAECFLSPKFLEYASMQAPKGEVGLYLGYQHLTTFFAWLFGFVMMGYLLDEYCPDPKDLEPEKRHTWRLATDPKYQFTLDEAMRDDLGDQIPVPASVREAMHAHDFELPARAAMYDVTPKDAWESDPERQWTIEEPMFTVALLSGAADPSTGLRVGPDAAYWSAKNTESAPVLLDADLWPKVTSGDVLASKMRGALVDNGFELPPEAIVREGIEEGANPGEKTWIIMAVLYRIGESKLETDATAKAAGRDGALRDVLVYSPIGRKLADTPPLPAEYARAHHVWYFFTGVGLTAFLGLLVFKFVTSAVDKKRAAREAA